MAIVVDDYGEAKVLLENVPGFELDREYDVAVTGVQRYRHRVAAASVRRRRNHSRQTAGATSSPFRG